MVKQFDHYLDNIQFILLSILVKLGPFFVALTPSIFTFWAIFALVIKSLIGVTNINGQPINPVLIFIVAFVFAAIPAFSIEAVGILVVHTAADLWDFVERGKTNPIKFKLMVALIPIYILAIVLVVGFSDAFPPLIRNLGIASPFLTVITYTAVTLNRSLSNIRAKDEEDKKAKFNKVAQEKEVMIIKTMEDKELAKIKLQQDFEIEKAERLKKLEFKHEEKMKKAELKSQGQVSEVKNRTLAKEENKSKLLEILNKPGKHTVQEISDSLGVSRVTVYTYMEELSSQVKYNGNGVELIKEEIREF